MPVAKVYAPLSGQIWNEGTYGDGSTHISPKCSGSVMCSCSTCCKAVDIGGAPGQSIDFRGNSRIRSIRTVQANICCKSNNTGPWHQSVIVKCYKDLSGEDYLGAIGYQHLTERVANGHYQTNFKFLGRLPEDMCNSACDCDNNKCCSDGVHIHIQLKDDSDGEYWSRGRLVHVDYASSTIFRWSY